MAIINCPECNSEISDTAKSCPYCGYKTNRSNPKNIRVRIRTGSIINVIGGLGMIAMYVALAFGRTPTHSEETMGSTFSISISGNASEFGYLVLLAAVILFAITIMSIVLLAKRDLKTSVILRVSIVQLILAVLAIICFVIAFNISICCYSWIIMWGTLLQVIGSALCLSGALKLND